MIWQVPLKRRLRILRSRRWVSLFGDSPEFHPAAGGNSQVNLARVALEIGRDAYPQIHIEAYLERIQHLANRARGRFKPGSSIWEIVKQINWVLFVEEEFRGNKEDYYDPRNSYLNEVLDRGLGIPITLSLVYWRMAERLGLAMSGVDLPLHFMLRIEDQGQPWFVDPFHGGVLYDRKGCEQRLSQIAEQEVTLPDAAIEPCRPGTDFADAQKSKGDLRKDRRNWISTYPSSAV